MIIVIQALIGLAWGFALGYCLARYDRSVPMIHLMQPDIEIAVAVCVGFVVETIFILGVVLL